MGRNSMAAEQYETITPERLMDRWGLWHTPRAKDILADLMIIWEKPHKADYSSIHAWGKAMVHYLNALEQTMLAILYAIDKQKADISMSDASCNLGLNLHSLIKFDQ
jgi:hypothetical protein